jgi:hypothetical protein
VDVDTIDEGLLVVAIAVVEEEAELIPLAVSRQFVTTL